MDVHNLKPGNLAIVAHRMKLHEFNAWCRPQGFQLSPDLLIETAPHTYYCVKLSAHIPHGSMVLVLKSIDPSIVIYREGLPKKSQAFYSVLWGEDTFLVERELLINPHINDIENS